MSSAVKSSPGAIVTRCITCGASERHTHAGSVALWSDIHRFETYNFHHQGREAFNPAREHRVERVYVTRDGREVDFTHCHRDRG